MIGEIKNIEDLRNELSSVFEKLVNGEIKVDVAKEINATASKIIDTAKIQLANCAMRKETPEIEFLKIEKSDIILAIDNLKNEES